MGGNFVEPVLPPPAIGTFTATAADQALSAVNSGVPGKVGCQGVFVQCPATDDAGVAQAGDKGLLVGTINRAQGSTVTYGPNLQPGDPPIFIECTDTSQVYVKRVGGTSTLAKFWCRRRTFTV